MNASKSHRVFVTVLTAAFAVLALQLIRLQIVERDKYLAHSEMNRIRRVRLVPPRGILYDRNGVVLVENRPVYVLCAVPFECRKSETSMNFLSRMLNEPVEAIKKRLAAEENPFFPVKLRRNIDYATVVQIEEGRMDLPGIEYDVETRRVYPSGLKAPHIFGYIGEISKNELKQRGAEGLSQGDLVGKKGFEKSYDRDLRGTVGYDFVEVDAHGRQMKDLVAEGEQPPIRGKDFYLTLDARLQTQAESLFVDKQGGVVMLDVRDGGVLVLCSKPDFDPEIFSGSLTPEQWQTLVDDPSKPLYDRMLQSIYPPGSTFKMVVATAALETGKCNPEARIGCSGAVSFGGRVFNCWVAKGHGLVDLYQALQVSCNVYFYNLSLRVPVDTWAEFARKFGFGQPTGIDLPGEEEGILPDRAYLDRVFGKNGWNNGMMLNLGIGQGDLLVTPIQMAQYAAILANRGVYYPPHLVNKIYDPQLQQFFRQDLRAKRVTGISEKTFATVLEGMYRVINAPGGTGAACRLSDVVVAGKTGTAQNPHGDPHAWFIGFAPFESPEVAVCVLIENGGGGGHNAAPIAAALLKEYFKGGRSTGAKSVSPQIAQ